MMRTSHFSPLSSGKNFLLLALVASLSAGVFGCGDDGGLVSGAHPSFDADPQSMLFTQVDVGQEQPRHIRIENSGDGDLDLENIQVQNDSGNSLYLDTEVDDEITLEQDEYLDLTVIYAPEDEGFHGGHISIDTNDPNLDDVFRCDGHDEESTQACIDIETRGFEPELHVSRTQVLFQAPPDGLDENYIQLRNIGAGSLEIDRLELTDDGGGDYAISFFDELDDGQLPEPREDDDTEASDVLEPGEETYMRMIFTPDDENESLGEVLIESNDPQEDRMEIELLGNTGAPCLEVVEGAGGSVDFGPGSINATNYQTVTLRNCSPEEDLEIEEISISVDAGGVFSIDDDNLPGDLPDSPKVLGPYEVTTMLVGFAPEEADNEYSGEMLIESNDHIESETYVPLTGIGVDSDCPIAEVAGAVGSAPMDNPVVATNQDVVQLSADGSYDPDEGPLTYEWSVIDGPGGSQAEVNPSNAEQPEFIVDIVGNFVIELEVFDETGLSNCEPAILEVWATPMEDIHIQLVWEAPEVEAAGGVITDEGSERGTDLDLHYVRPGGSWGDAQDSIYWQYDGQDWNGDGTDNAILDIDDLLGAEPENINHSEPEVGEHEVGVHYYRDHCWGAADATVRIYFGETLIEERQGRLDQTDNFWYVATIDWQGSPQESSVNVLNQVTETHSLQSHWDLFGEGSC